MQNSLYVSLDNGGKVDVRLVTQQGTCVAPKLETSPLITRLETPSPSSSNCSESSTSNKPTLVTNEHTYFCNPEHKKEQDELENQLAARIIFKNSLAQHSLRRFFQMIPI